LRQLKVFELKKRDNFRQQGSIRFLEISKALETYMVSKISEKPNDLFDELKTIVTHILEDEFMDENTSDDKAMAPVRKPSKRGKK